MDLLKEFFSECQSREVWYNGVWAASCLVVFVLSILATMWSCSRAARTKWDDPGIKLLVLGSVVCLLFFGLAFLCYMGDFADAVFFPLRAGVKGVIRLVPGD